ncbi:unnamed protein product [Coccothraustes coccothraustes]
MDLHCPAGIAQNPVEHHFSAASSIMGWLRWAAAAALGGPATTGQTPRKTPRHHHSQCGFSDHCQQLPAPLRHVATTWLLGAAGSVRPLPRVGRGQPHRAGGPCGSPNLSSRCPGPQQRRKKKPKPTSFCGGATRRARSSFQLSLSPAPPLKTAFISFVTSFLGFILSPPHCSFSLTPSLTCLLLNKPPGVHSILLSPAQQPHG